MCLPVEFRNERGAISLSVSERSRYGKQSDGRTPRKSARLTHPGEAETDYDILGLRLIFR